MLDLGRRVPFRLRQAHVLTLLAALAVPALVAGLPSEPPPPPSARGGHHRLPGEPAVPHEAQPARAAEPAALAPAQRPLRARRQPRTSTCSSR